MPVTESEWLASLAHLRAGGGTRGSYLVRWWPKQYLDAGVGGGPFGLLVLVVRLVRSAVGSLGDPFDDSRGQRERYDLALYPAGAVSGSVPLVLVPVGADEPVQLLSQGQEVDVRGDVEAGGAVVIDHPGHGFDPIGPCRVPAFWPRRYRL